MPRAWACGPRNLRLAPAAGDIVLPAKVQLLEPLGAETLVTLNVGNTDMVARCPASFRQPAGTDVALHVHPDHLHLFDRQGGQAL